MKRNGFIPLEISRLNKSYEVVHILGDKAKGTTAGKMFKRRRFLSLAAPVRKTSSNGAGFTLIELLIALGIFSVVAASIYSTFSMGINTWKRMEGLLERYQEARLLLERMGWELRNCVDIDIEGFNNIEDAEKIDFKGGKEKLAFFTVRSAGIKRVIYQKKESQKLEGVGRVFLIERTEEDFTTGPVPDDPSGDMVLDLVKEVEFRYLNPEKGIDKQMEWQENWTGEEAKKIPLQVWIRIIFYVPTGKRDDFEEVTIDKYADIVSAPRT